MLVKWYKIIFYLLFFLNSQFLLCDGLKIFNAGKVFFVSPNGNDNFTGLSSVLPFAHIQKALEKAYPGDTIVLLPGKYYENFHSVRSGKKNNPIIIIGSPNVIIFGKKKYGGRIIDITHSYIYLMNLKINGNYNKNCKDIKCFHDKLIYIHGSYNKLLTGIKILGCELKNALGECLRIKYSKNSEIGWNKISHCGIRNFIFKKGKQNGEGIYVGTALEQSKDKPDNTHSIFIYNNSIATYGSECIDIKENSYNITVANNICLKEKEKKVAGISIRGNKNKIYNNIIFNNKGAGIRVGGDTKKFGIYNTIINNYLENNLVCGLKIMVLPQEKMCSNVTNRENPYYPINPIFEKAFTSCGK